MLANRKRPRPQTKAIRSEVWRLKLTASAHLKIDLQCTWGHSPVLSVTNLVQLDMLELGVGGHCVIIKKNNEIFWNTEMRTLRGFAQETRVNATTVVSWLNARRPNPRFKFESMLPFHPPPAREKRTSAHALPHLLFSFFFVATGTWPFLFVPSARQMTRVVSTQGYSTGSGSVKCPMTDTKLIAIDNKKHRSWKPKIYSSN